MTFDLALIDQAAEKIQQKIKSGEITEACCMSAIATPVTESWDMAQEIAKISPLSSEQQQILLKALKQDIQKQLTATGFDDFDLIYQRLLQLVTTP